MIEGRRAIVRPRVVSAESGEALLLEDEILRLVESGTCGRVFLVGPAGAGKTTALRYLATVVPRGCRIRLLDASVSEDVDSPYDCLVVQAAPTAGTSSGLVYRLASWQRDDLIEYLLAVHRKHCAAVMARIQVSDFALLGGLPELWSAVLDRLAADENLPDARSALHTSLAEHLCDTDLLERTRSACLNAELAGNLDPLRTMQELARPGFAPSLVRLLLQPSVRSLLAGERIAADLHGEASCDYLAHRLPRPLVEVTATLARHDLQAREHLHRLLAGPAWSHAMSASLLLALDPSWKPQGQSPPLLAGAYLDHAAWPEVQLVRADLDAASLQGADLSGANLTQACLWHTNLRRARLRGASLVWVKGWEANLSGADLTAAYCDGIILTGANLERTNLTGAELKGANLVDSRLNGASFRFANLQEAVFLGASIEGADFFKADLTGANLRSLCLRQARWDGACFEKATLDGCDLEGLCLPGVCFDGAKLCGALLTGTSMFGASFQGAKLAGAGLAEIDWEGVDLRDADLRGASFHLGSTRSGLVGSPLACEGSRTGFYTDDYEEQTYKAPEEIRKANLCGSDLRGARLEGVDFYLVDLRGARLDPGVADLLRSRGAILDPPRCC